MPELTERELRILTRLRLHPFVGYWFVLLSALNVFLLGPVLAGREWIACLVDPLLFLCGVVWLMLGRQADRQRADVLSAIAWRSEAVPQPRTKPPGCRVYYHAKQWEEDQFWFGAPDHSGFETVWDRGMFSVRTLETPFHRYWHVLPRGVDRIEIIIDGYRPSWEEK